MGNFFFFSAPIFRNFSPDDFWRIFAKNSWVVGGHIVLLASLLMHILLLFCLYYSGILVVAGLPSAVDTVMFLLSLLLLASLHAVATLLLQASLLLMASTLCWRSCCCFHSCCCLRSCCCPPLQLKKIIFLLWIWAYLYLRLEGFLGPTELPSKVQ